MCCCCWTTGRRPAWCCCVFFWPSGVSPADSEFDFQHLWQTFIKQTNPVDHEFGKFFVIFMPLKDISPRPEKMLLTRSMKNIQIYKIIIIINLKGQKLTIYEKSVQCYGPAWPSLILQIDGRSWRSLSSSTEQQMYVELENQTLCNNIFNVLNFGVVGSSCCQTQQHSILARLLVFSCPPSSTVTKTFLARSENPIQRQLLVIHDAIAMRRTFEKNTFDVSGRRTSARKK